MKQLSEPTPSKPVRITTVLLEEWQAAEERRLALQSEARDLAKRQSQIEQQLMPAVLERAGSVRRIESCGFELAIVTKKGHPSWKSEFIRVAGQQAANELIANAPTKDELEIRKL